MLVDRLSEIFPARPDAVSDLNAGWTPALMLVGVVLVAALSCFAQEGHPVAPQAPVSAATAPKSQTETASKLQKAVAADSERKKQISDESTQLLAMALSLKAEVDKTNKDTLSLNVIRKADEIERLAKTVKEKIKQGSGPE